MYNNIFGLYNEATDNFHGRGSTQAVQLVQTALLKDADSKLALIEEMCPASNLPRAFLKNNNS